ncbi:FUSC family protein [Aerococcus urinae]|uniref:Aromatic acid exporter family protein n=4 Tax=Lactobacillales TaxID=186826 RepID=A0A0X8FF43_9LACT|nr:aromatic acid exporter family protein [Aerococcus urinae]AMB96185.1 lantibiotic ABC transporter permease [Aerococcus urinae]MCY3033369.1 aromatic acid exporter family protein [Aerococcus urinae]MCY3038561.1 aromatic acid exporter family protein [Aerococcus urinae]MCY3045471.1 aromatic acid exporter family protein [Aerococcus urinae]MCY3047155.1 aromatic acid exporter family protein [Aerococcus urinae]
MKLGARTIKTGIGVMLAMVISSLLPHIEIMQPTFVAVLGLQQSVKKTWYTLFRRGAAAFLGGLTAVVMSYFFGNSPIVVGLTVIIFIAIMNAIQLQDVISLATITVVIIMLQPVDNVNDLIGIATSRVIENILGVVISFLVNVFIMPPKYDNVLYKEISDTSSEVLIRLRAILRKNGEYSSLTSDLDWAYKRINYIRDLFQLSKEEPIWFASRRVSRKRQLVVYRSFIQSLLDMTNLLHTIHTHTNILFVIDDDLRIQIRERIETLCAAHEQIFLKFDGRISPAEVNFFQPTKIRRQELMNHIIKETDLNRGPETESLNYRIEKSNSLILITGAMIKVESSLIHLNTLVRSYHTHHEEDHDHYALKDKLNS